MKHEYTILPEPLHPIADLAISYFVKSRGVSTSSVKIERPINDSLKYRPTFTAKTTDQYILCVDVGSSPYTNSLDEFVLESMSQGIPLKLFIAIPKGTKDPEYAQKLGQAKSRCVGVLEVDNRSANVFQEALALSLAGVRTIAIQEFPPKLREAVTRADGMFRNGIPDKACSQIFEEIESISRALAKKTYDDGHWKCALPSGFKIKTGPWARLMALLEEQLNLKNCGCPELTRPLLARIHGITPHRNETNHKPQSIEALKKRDRELRTRFESAIDLLRDLAEAVKPLRVI